MRDLVKCASTLGTPVEDLMEAIREKAELGLAGQ